MTVAAVILVPDPAVALSDADGLPALRRAVQSAWAGGALPIVVVSHASAESDALAAAIEGLPASLIRPEDVPPGAGWFGAGVAAARELVGDTEAALLWPARFAWIDPETVTSTIEAHGADLSAIVRPAYEGQPGFPILVPAAHRTRFVAERTLHAFQIVDTLVAEGAATRTLELGDPGIVMDVSTPRDALPAYQGPPVPAGAPEWNAELGAHAQRSDTPAT